MVFTHTSHEADITAEAAETQQTLINTGGDGGNGPAPPVAGPSSASTEDYSSSSLSSVSAEDHASLTRILHWPRAIPPQPWSSYSLPNMPTTFSDGERARATAALRGLSVLVGRNDLARDSTTYR